MTADQLQQVLQQLGVVRCGSGTVAKCIHCQPEETDAEHYHLQVGIGSCYPVILFCVKCCYPKPVDDEQRSHNRRYSRSVFQLSGCDLDFCYQRMQAEDIRKLWSQVRIGGFTPVAVAERADDDHLHFAYSELLSGLTLSERHRKWLRKRGLDPEWCFDRGYRTVVQREWEGPLLKGVPGLNGRQWLLREDALLIPCRDREGRIGAVKQRLSSDGRSRMRLLSGGGTKAKSMLHWPLGAGADGVLFITEGERKADALYYHYRQPVVGIPGVGRWAAAVADGVRYGAVILALDDDEAGHKCRNLLGQQLTAEGVAVSVAKWPEQWKKIDDALAGGGKVTVEQWQGSGEESKPHTQPKGSTGLVRGQPLSDSQIIRYLRQFGPTLRSELKAFDLTVSAMIRSGQISMVKTADGQLLRVANGCSTVES
jgi:5S rRNA maturation endonuclease (ribonuclease M5)